MELKDARLGTEESLEELLARIHPKLRAIACRYHVPEHDAEDLIQQALLAFVQKQKLVRNVETWLAGTVRKQCLMYLRSRRRRLYNAVDASILDLIATPQEPQQGKTDIVCDLDAAISRISPRCQSLLRLRYGLGFEAAEVAEQMGYRSSSIRKVTTRCLAALTEQMMAAGYPDPKAEPEGEPAATAGESGT